VHAGAANGAGDGSQFSMLHERESSLVKKECKLRLK